MNRCSLPLLALTASLSLAQERLRESCESQDAAFHGYAVAFTGGDLPGDVTTVAGAPNARGQGNFGVIGEGRVAWGSTFPRAEGDDLGDRLGAAVIGGLHLDGPATPGLGRGVVAGAPGDDDGGDGAGSVRAYRGDRSVLYTLHGAAAGDGLGTSLAALSDLDGDGFDDYLAGAPESASGGPGHVHVISGATGAILRTHTGAAAGDRLGRGLAALPDLDGDGVGDYAVGAPGAAGGRGVVTLHSGVSGAVLRTHTGAAPGDELGFAVASGGDVDRDGGLDYVMGAPRGGLQRGAAFVHRGVDGTLLLTLDGEEPHGRFGAAVALARDFQGDGYGDVVVGEPGIEQMWGTNYDGAATVFSGRDGAPLARSTGGWSAAGAGISVATGADLDGDGLDDVVVGGMLSNDSYGASSCYSVLGRTVGVPHAVGEDTTRYGYALSAAGDLDGDGRPELAVGAPTGFDPGGTRTGVVVIQSPDGEEHLRLFGLGQGDEFGVALAAAGDVDGDGVEDLVVGAARRLGGNSQGGGYARLHSGATGALLHHLPGPGDPWFGAAVDGGVDVDGDGVPDVIVGGGRGSTGHVRVFSGATGAVVHDLSDPSVNGEDFGYGVALLEDLDGDGKGEFAIASPGRQISTPIWALGVVDVRSGADATVLGSYATDLHLFVGVALETVGDVDGDGLDDLAVSSWEPQPLLSYGSVHVFSTATFQRLWHQEYQTSYEGVTFGYSLARVGDVTGDGVDDLLVGVPGENTHGARAIGSARLLSGADGSTLQRLDGANGWDYFGYSVAALGDVDGDGEADFALGAPTEPNNTSFAEVGLPGVRIIRSDPLLVRTFCPSAVNGAGQPATLRAEGSSSIARGALGLRLEGMPQPTLGLFVASPSEAVAALPGASGYHFCLGSTAVRLTPGLSSTDGTLAHGVDLTRLGVAAGERWSFQGFFRDVGGALASSDAVRVEFTP